MNASQLSASQPTVHRCKQMSHCESLLQKISGELGSPTQVDHLAACLLRNIHPGGPAFVASLDIREQERAWESMAYQVLMKW